MRKIIFLLSALFLFVSPKAGLSAASEMSLVYREYVNENTTEEMTGETFITIKEISDVQTVINRQKRFEHCTVKDKFILDRDYSLESWTRICAEEDTEFTSLRDGNTLYIKGKVKGEAVDKALELGNKALHIYPKYSLSKFALSGMPKMKLWSLRRDRLTKLPMQAIRKGIEKIVIDGKEVEVIKVYYSITGKLREKHFNHNYYFRRSDGLFLKKEENNGKIEVLVKEE